MENLTNNKKYLTLILIGLLTLVIGVSLSFIMFDLSGNDNSIKNGQVSFVYTEPSNEVVLKDQLPITDELGKNQDKYFEFSVMSNATTNVTDKTGVNIFYEISLSKKDVEQIYNQLEDDQVKIYLTKVVGNEETVILEPTLISELEKSEYGDSLKIYNTKNKHHGNNGGITTKYRLRFWIDNEVNATNWYKENKYEYRFVVNVNGHAPNLDIINDNTLAGKIKKMYTVENGAAVEEDGYYYLQGTENATNDKKTVMLTNFGEIMGVYLYRQEANKVKTKPTSNVKKLTDTKTYTYNQELLEHDIHNYIILSGEVSEQEYDRVTKPFGGYVNAMLGMLAGVVTDDMTYAEGKTIEDIPTLDDAMKDANMKEMTKEMFNELAALAIVSNKESFITLYSDNGIFDQELLNANIELGAIDIGAESMIPTINDNFGNLSNYVIAISSGMVEDEKLSYGYEIKDIPTLESIFLSEKGNVLLSNTYVNLNRTLWKVLGINSDNTIRLIATNKLEYPADGTFLNSNVGKFLGFDNYKYSSFMSLIKDTTLEEVIVKTNYIYEDEGEKGKILSYAGMPTYNEIRNTIVDGYSYLMSTESNKNYISVSEGLTITENNKKIKKYKSFYNDEYDNQITKESNESTIYLQPVITIENIEVIGEGTKNNPFIIEREKIQTEKGLAQSLARAYIYAPAKNYSFYQNIGDNYNLSIDKSGYFVFDNEVYSAGISVNDKCYYETRDEISKMLEYSGNCADKFSNIIKEPENLINTWIFNETNISVEATNADSYQWQQKIGDEWIELEELSGRVIGSKTNTLTIIPTKDFASTNYYRCVVKNDISKAITKEITVNIGLSDGEWVYEEIEDTNKYQIVSYIGNYANSSYFSLMDDGTNYHLNVPSIINGDEIVNIKSVYEDTNIGESEWYAAALKTKSIEFEAGIKKIESRFEYYPGYSSYLEKIKFNEGLEVIGDKSFINTYNLTTLEIPNSVKTIGEDAFFSSNLIELILNEGLETIEPDAFYCSDLTTLEIPSTVKTIGSSAFHNSPLTDLALYEGIEIIDNSAFYNAELTTLEIPSTVKTIGNGSFRNSPITTLILKNGELETIGDYAFYNSDLTILEIPSKVKTIGSDAFYNSILTTLTLHEDLETIGNYAFEKSELTSIVIPETVTEIGTSAFEKSKLTSLVIPNSVTKIGSQAFYESELTSLKLSNNLTSIEAWTFYNAKLTEISIPSKITHIGKSAFCNSIFTELKLPNKLETIGDYAFNESLLTSLEVPASVKTIGGAAFKKSPLTTLILHEGLERIETVCTGPGGIIKCQDEGAFYSAQLESLSIPASVKRIENNNFYHSRFKDLKIYGKTSIADIVSSTSQVFRMATGYEPQFIEGTLE